MPNDLETPYFPLYSSPSPVDSDHLQSLLDGSISAILGGSRPALLPGETWPRCGECDEPLIPYIQLNVSSAHTPSDFRSKVGVPPTPGHTVVLQVFVCATDENGECFEQCIVSGGGGDNPKAWLVRVVQLMDVDVGAVDAARAEMEEDRFFIDQRVIAGWTAGTPEMLHSEAHTDYDEELYEAHEPAGGLKLLGNAVRGKYFSTEYDFDCPRRGEGPGDRCEWRCLLQLGTDNEGQAPLCSVGNTWIDQCVMHPDAFSMTISGNW